jgi:hypothetical protein
MRLLATVLLISCGGSADPELGPAPGADQPSPDHVPVAGEGEISARLSGKVEVPSFTGGMIQMDAVAEVDGQSHVVANERYEEPGEFRLVVRGEHKSVDIVVYLISGDGGPAAGDVRFEYSGNPVSLVSGEDGVFELADMVITVIPAEEQAGPGAGKPLGDVQDNAPLGSPQLDSPGADGAEPAVTQE